MGKFSVFFLVSGLAATQVKKFSSSQPKILKNKTENESNFSLFVFKNLYLSKKNIKNFFRILKF